MTSQTAKYQLVTAESGDASDMPTYTAAAMGSVEAALDRVLSQANAVANTKVNKAGDSMTGQLNAPAVAAGAVGGAGTGLTVHDNAALNGDVNVGKNLFVNGVTHLRGAEIVMGALPAKSDAPVTGWTWMVRSAVGQLYGLTDVTFRLNVAAIAQTSTRRLKTKIGPAKATPDVTALQPRAYTWTDEAFKVSAPGTRLGLIAEEVADVDPRLVTRDAEGQVAGLDQHALIAALVSKVTELQARIATLEGKPS